MKQVFSLMYWNIILYIDHIVSFELWTHQILKKTILQVQLLHYLCNELDQTE